MSSYDQIDAYRTLTYKELHDHIHDRTISAPYDEYVGDSERLGRLLLKLPSLAELDTGIIEEIFFVGLIGRRREKETSEDHALLFCGLQARCKFTKSFRAY